MGWGLLIISAGLLIGLTWLATRWNMDLRLEARFYQSDSGWFLARSPVWLFLYHYGTLPGLLLTLAAAVCWIAGLKHCRLRRWRRQAMLVVLTSVIGAGLLVNAVLKPYWGRPRPRQTIAFEGRLPYHPVHQPGIPGQGASFPCGHCTMGFLFVTLAFCGHRSRNLAIAGGLFGLTYGLLLGVARMIQGAHFATDVLWSLGIILLTAILLHFFVIPRLMTSTLSMLQLLRRHWIRPMLLVAAGLLTTAAFLTHRPYYQAFEHESVLPAGVWHIDIDANVTFSSEQINYDGPGGKIRVVVHSNGFGWIAANQDRQLRVAVRQGRLHWVAHFSQRGYFSELDHHIIVHLPRQHPSDLQVSINRGQ
jgi:lipid A 4'-phosphatase